MMPEFFDYTCDRCGAPFCERVQLMNLALDYVDEQFCLACLAAGQDMNETAMADFARDYIDSRECFKTPWEKFDATGCPKLATHSCHCQDASV